MQLSQSDQNFAMKLPSKFRTHAKCSSSFLRCITSPPPPTHHSENDTSFNSRRSSLPPGYLHQKDERALPRRFQEYYEYNSAFFRVITTCWGAQTWGSRNTFRKTRPSLTSTGIVPPGQVPLPELRLSPRIIPPMPLIHLHLKTIVNRKTKTRRSGNLKQSNALVHMEVHFYCNTCYCRNPKIGKT